MMMRLFGFLVLGLSVVMMGCQGEKSEGGSDEKKDDAQAKSSVSAPLLCSKCGEESGSDKCCDDSIATCDCGFHAESPLCCNKGGIKPTEEAGEYCSCGNLKGAENCCSGASACGCGYEHGSTLCTAMCGEHSHGDEDDDHEDDDHDAEDHS